MLSNNLNITTKEDAIAIRLQTTLASTWFSFFVHDRWKPISPGTSWKSMNDRRLVELIRVYDTSILSESEILLYENFASHIFTTAVGRRSRGK
jgi:hypothetical protein